MIFKTDKDGFIINEGDLSKIQPEYRGILEEIKKCSIENLGKKLLGIYIRGSVSTGKAVRGISDIDTVIISKGKIPRKDRFWSVKLSKDLERKYPFIEGADITIVGSKDILTSKKYFGLRVNLVTQSVNLYGKEILHRTKTPKPGIELSKKMLDGMESELTYLRRIFKGEIKKPEYNDRRRPTKFWCIWMARTMLRGGMGILMLKRPVYSRDLKDCLELFSKEYPEYKKYMEKAYFWSMHSTSNKSELVNYIDDFGPKLLEIWKNNLITFKKPK
ncbi:MAG: nucleotidyltransferase domain-containing protein [Candidatus Moraniibacteriota bacterium]